MKKENWKELLRENITKDGKLKGTFVPSKSIPINEFTREIKIIMKERHNAI